MKRVNGTRRIQLSLIRGGGASLSELRKQKKLDEDCKLD